MLSIGRIGNTDRDRMWRYWRDAVVPTGARLVVPIHWDDPTQALGLPLVATPYVADRVDAAMATFTEFAGERTAVMLPVTNGALLFPRELASRCSV